MLLKLEVANDPSRREPTVFTEAGGTIGRAAGATLTLPDPFVSNNHARILHRGGTFLIEDISQNGIAVNSPANRLVKGQPYELASGDLLIIDPYEIKVAIEDSVSASAKSSGAVDPFPPVQGSGEASGNWLINGEKKKKKAVGLGDLPRPRSYEQQFVPPAPILPPEAEPDEPPALIPDDWKDLTNSGLPTPPVVGKDQPSPRVDPTPLRVPVVPSGVDAPRMSGELSEVLKGAGLPSDIVTPELARDFGRIIRTVVTGLMEVLKSRQEIKDEFRIHQTRIQGTGNNPLKFSANLEDALHRLLLQRNPGYLEPVKAFEDAFEDLLHHQMAMLAGMRAAFDATLKAFDPDVLQAEFDKGGRGGLIPGFGKPPYWDLYRTTFGDMVRDADCFQNLFGEEFANAYDEQLERLKDRRPSAPPPESNRPGRSRR